MHDVSGRDIAALFDPRPIVIVGACTDEGAANFATIIWAMPISHHPSMVAFALRETSRTMELLRASGALSLSILPATEEGVRIAEACGTVSGRKADKAAAVPHAVVSLEPGAFVPIPEAATSWLICAVDDIRPAGDHLLVTCTVDKARTSAPRDERGRIAPAGEDALLCIQHGDYAQAIRI